MGPQFSNLATSVLVKKEYGGKTQIQAKVYLESHRSSRSEPAGFCGLRKKVTEVKEDPWSLERKKGKENRF